jgi:transposase
MVAMVTLLTGWFRLSKRNAQEALQMLFGADISLGAVSKCERRTSEAVAGAVAEAREYVANQPVRYADETTWREAGRKAWLWVASTPWVAVFLIQGHRAKECAHQLLGKIQGILVTDRMLSYKFWPMQQRQICWAHLVREFRAWAEEKQGSYPHLIGTAILSQTDTMFRLWHRVQQGTLTRATFQKRMIPIRRKIERELKKGAHCGFLRFGGKCRDILEHRQALWTFVHVQGVEPTNNEAERALRHAVILRKTSFGTDSPRGSRFLERMLSVVTSLRKQGRNPFDFLVESCRARMNRTPAPPIIPSS